MISAILGQKLISAIKLSPEFRGVLICGAGENIAVCIEEVLRRMDLATGLKS